MAQDIEGLPEYHDAMARLEGLKHVNASGREYWLAREIHPAFGYPVWDKFEPAIDRARQSLTANRVNPADHIAPTSKMVEVGSGAQRRVGDYFLSRAAAYLIAMNGDPTKPQIAAAQAYFAVQTRRVEISDEEKRLELRDRVKQSFRRVSGVANDAGVRNTMQAIFHDARYQGLYGMSARDVKRRKGLQEKENLFDRAGPLELSANDFQMNLAADVIASEQIRGEAAAINKNKQLAQHVRKTMETSGATLPENLPLEAPIKEVAKRVAEKKKSIS